jgi:hypothetical protein
MKIEIRSFSGIAPRYSPELINEQNGQIAQNISIKSGKIHPEKKFLVKLPDRDYVPGQINDDQYHRIYFLDDNGTLCVAGTFPDKNGNVSAELISRTVDISAPGKPVLSYTSSPLLDAIGGMNGGKMYANFGSTSDKATPGFATHIYSVYEMIPIDDKWKEDVDGNLERTYAYNPYYTDIIRRFGQEIKEGA